MNRNTIACLVLFSGLAFSGAAAAQSEPQARPPLSGPEVAEQRLEGVGSGFSSMTARSRTAQPVPMAVFRRALAELAGDSAPEGARLSEQQIQRLRAIQGEHREAQQAFRREHAAEFRALREALGPALADRLDRSDDRPGPQRRRAGLADRTSSSASGPRPGEGQQRSGGGRGEAMAPEGGAGSGGGMGPDRPDRPRRPEREDRPAGRGDLTEGQRAAIGRLQELRSRAPGVEGLQTRIWAELTEPQQAHVQARIDEHRAAMAERRAAAYVERMMAERAAAGAESGQPARRPSGAGLRPELRETLESLPEPLRQRVGQLPPQRLERLLERLARLTPEERAQVLRRSVRDRRGDPSGGTSGARTSPPPVEDLRVPQVDQDG